MSELEGRLSLLENLVGKSDSKGVSDTHTHTDSLDPFSVFSL